MRGFEDSWEPIYHADIYYFQPADILPNFTSDRTFIQERLQLAIYKMQGLLKNLIICA